MKSNKLRYVIIALTPAAVVALASCSSTPKVEPTQTAAYQQGVPGGVFVQTYKNTATVTAIDAANRKVTLVTRDGRMDTFKAGPEVVNFDQIRIGDQVKATVTERLVVYMAKDNPPASEGEAALVALAPQGAKPGGLVANTVQVVAKITAIDHKRHKATLKFPDGTTKTFAVRQDVDLTQRKVGDEVVIRATEAVAISVEKP
jgi:Cu/Ag efflux protein CusF